MPAAVTATLWIDQLELAQVADLIRALVDRYNCVVEQRRRRIKKART